MIKNTYVVDYIVTDIEKAKVFYDRIFGTEPLWINPNMAPNVTVNAMYYQMPGPVGHVTTLGFFEENEDIKTDHEGAKLLGIQCNDLDATISEMAFRGVRFMTDEPQPYAVGRNISTIEYNGVSFSISEHEPGGHERARQMMFTRDGVNDYGDASQGGLLDRIHLIHVAVKNMHEATENFRRVLGVEPVKEDNGKSNNDLDAVYFPAPGGGFGVQYIVLVHPKNSSPSTDEGRLVLSHVQTCGEGIYMIGILVSDIVETKDLLTSRGVNISSAELALAESLGRGFCLEPLHNVKLWFSMQEKGTLDYFLQDR